MKEQGRKDFFLRPCFLMPVFSQLNAKMKIDIISKITGLSKEEIKKLM